MCLIGEIPRRGSRLDSIDAESVGNGKRIHCFNSLPLS